MPPRVTASARQASARRFNPNFSRRFTGMAVAARSMVMVSITAFLAFRYLAEVLSLAVARSPARTLYLRRVGASAAGPAAERKAGVARGRPLLRSTKTGSASSPVLLSMTTTLAPSGAKCLLPQASSAHSTGRKSRPAQHVLVARRSLAVAAAFEKTRFDQGL